jgi:hypothetical protein
MTADNRVIKWDAVALGVTVVLVLLGFNAWCMKLIINDALSNNMTIVMKEFVTKADFNRHVDHCENKIK